MVNVPYTCPRCGYECKQKIDMRRHLYHKKKICPAIVHVIELTDTIKEHILENRIYKIEKPTQVINNFNTICNFVTSLDPLNKLHRYHEACKVKPLTIEQKVLKRYNRKNKNLDNLHGDIQVEQEDIIEALQVVNMSEASNFSDYCIVHDGKYNKLSIFDGLSWYSTTFNIGILAIWNKLKELHFDKYEWYLVQKIESSAIKEDKKAKCRELLRYYYFVLACFDSIPYMESTLNQVSDDSKEKYLKIFKDVCEETTLQKIKQFKTEVKDQIKLHGQHNIRNLNEYLMQMIKVDSGFIQSLTTETTIPVQFSHI